MAFAVGETVGPYRILEQLGQGGMATVYKAYHAALDRYVALKVLHQAFLEDANFNARFQREARVVAKLEHPNIVPIYDFAEHEKQPYLVMKHIEGETLKARLGRGPLSSDDIGLVIDSIGKALAYAHKQGILHRDIKPSNVLLATDGQIYLADFGLARIAQAGESTLTTDMIMGTPQYISPEQAMGVKELDSGTDIYSFGVMLYELTVGKVPFSADTPYSIIHDHIYTPLPLPRQVNPNVPAAVERVLLKALAKEREHRFADITALVEAFKVAWGESGIPDQPDTLVLPINREVEVATSSPIPAPDIETLPELGQPDRPEALQPDSENRKKKWSKWILIAASVLIILCCLVVILWTRNARNSRNDINNQINRQTETANESAITTKSPTEPRPIFDAGTAIEEARRFTEENPEDPYARLELAMVLADAKMMEEAINQLHNSADLAGENLDFFYHARMILAERDFMPGAAYMNFRVAKLEGPEISGDTWQFLSSSVYWAYIEPYAPQVLPFEELARLSEPLQLIAQARFALHNQGIDEARHWIIIMIENNFKLPEIRLIQAEIALWEGNYDETRALLNSLFEEPEIPDWIRKEAELLMAEIP